MRRPGPQDGMPGAKRRHDGPPPPLGNYGFRFLGPEVLASGIIGTGGCVAAEIQQRSGVRLSVTKRGEVFPGTGYRVGTISGTSDEAIQQGMQLIIEKLEDCVRTAQSGQGTSEGLVGSVTGEVIFRPLIPSIMLSSIVGEDGSDTSGIISRTSVSFVVGKEKSGSGDSAEQCLAMTGPALNVRTALKEIVGMVQSKSSEPWFRNWVTAVGSDIAGAGDGPRIGPRVSVRPPLLSTPPGVSKISDASYSVANVAHSLAGSCAMRFVAPEVLASGLIGTGGCVASDIQARSGVRLSVTRRGEYYPGTSHRVATISGQSADMIQRGCGLVIEKLQDLIRNAQNGHGTSEGLTGKETGEIKIRPLVPVVVAEGYFGPSGENIAQLKERTGTQFEIAPEFFGVGMASERIVTLTGEPQAVTIGLQELAGIIQSCNVQPWFVEWATGVGTVGLASGNPGARAIASSLQAAAAQVPDQVTQMQQMEAQLAQLNQMSALSQYSQMAQTAQLAQLAQMGQMDALLASGLGGLPGMQFGGLSGVDLSALGLGANSLQGLGLPGGASGVAGLLPPATGIEGGTTLPAIANGVGLPEGLVPPVAAAGSDAKVDLLKKVVGMVPPQVTTDPRGFSLSCVVPGQLVSSLIGSDGQNSREVGERTGTKIEIRDIPGDLNKSLTITGPLIATTTAFMLMMARYIEVEKNPAASAAMPPMISGAGAPASNSLGLPGAMGLPLAGASGNPLGSLLGGLDLAGLGAQASGLGGLDAGQVLAFLNAQQAQKPN